MDDVNIETPREEFNFWQRAEQTATNPESKKKALYFQECYK